MYSAKLGLISCEDCGCLTDVNKRLDNMTDSYINCMKCNASLFEQKTFLKSVVCKGFAEGMNAVFPTEEEIIISPKAIDDEGVFSYNVLSGKEIRCWQLYPKGIEIVPSFLWRTYITIANYLATNMVTPLLNLIGMPESFRKRLIKLNYACLLAKSIK